MITIASRPARTAFALALLGGSLSLIEPAFAGLPVPAPVVGAGLPILLILGGAYLLVRKLRGRSDVD